jgi:hypothetical protein
MYLGNRSIRSAGKTSGSIEITLPAQLQILQGLACRMTVRDGSRPEIVLQPDLSTCQSLFQALWEKVRLGLGEIDDIGDFAPGDFALVLFAPPHWQERPPLAYADGLGVLHWRAGQGGDGPEALTRLLASLAVVSGFRLGLKGVISLAFGDAVAYVMTGSPAGLGTDFERGMAHRVFWRGEAGIWQAPMDGLDDRVWRAARWGFHRVYDQFSIWQETPEVCIAARDMWYRALKLDMQMPHGGSHMGRIPKPAGVSAIMERENDNSPTNSH